MPEFVNPFSGKIPERKLTSEELVRAIRLDLAAEHEAVHAYTAHADATDNPVAKAVLIDIANEERVHAGEFARLLAILTGDEDEFLQKGALEVNALSAKIAQSGQGTVDKEIPTVGSLKTG
jgi:rubrerythrin